MSVFNTAPPNFSILEAETLLQDLYGITADISLLTSERDQNFLCNTESKKFILKISNPDEERDILEMQHECLTYIKSQDPSLQVPLQFNEIKKIDECYVRLVNYLPGKFFMDVEHHNGLLYDIGSFLGRLKLAMTGFDHPAGHRDFPWDVAYIDFIKDQKHQLNRNEELVDYFIEKYQQNVLPVSDSFRKAMNHNDANEHNVLVDDNGNIIGIIDFGDMIHTFIACEPAVCMAYVALEKDDPLLSIKQVLKGFHDQFPLTEIELSKVVYLLCMRSCITLTMAAYRMKLFPENEYISVNKNQAFQFLTRMKYENLKAWSETLVNYCES